MGRGNSITDRLTLDELVSRNIAARDSAFGDLVWEETVQPNRTVLRRCIDTKTGELHCEDGPAETKRRDMFSDGEILIESYFIQGLLHRKGGPAKQTTNRRIITSEEWYENGGRVAMNDQPEGFNSVRRIGNQILCQRLDENGNLDSLDPYGEASGPHPASVTKTADGIILLEHYSEPGRGSHRIDGPAIISYYEDPHVVKSKEYFLHGEPACSEAYSSDTTYWPSGCKKSENWQLPSGRIFRQIDFEEEGGVSAIWYLDEDLEQVDVDFNVGVFVWPEEALVKNYAVNLFG